MNKSPCRYYCEQRDIDCHSKCKLYLQYREYQNKVNEMKRMKSEMIDYSIIARRRMGVAREI